MSVTFADNLTNLEGILSRPVGFEFTDLSSVLMSETVASSIVNFSAMLMFFLIPTILGWLSNFLIICFTQ